MLFRRCGQAKAIELIGNKRETNEAQIAEQSFCPIWQCVSQQMTPLTLQHTLVCGGAKAMSFF